MERSPLYTLQKKAGAAFEKAFGWEAPQVYTSVQEEYQAATEGVALADRSSVGRLKATGKDALDLIDRLSTNKLEELVPGEVLPTVLTSNKGRIIDYFLVASLKEYLLLLTAPQNRQKVAEWIDLYTFLEEVAVEDITPGTAMLSIVGPKAEQMLRSIGGLEETLLLGCAAAQWQGVEITSVRTDFAGVPAYDLVVEASQAEALWQHILDGGASLGIRPVGAEALEAIRIENGIPVYGRELSEKHNPLEANLLHAVSFNKGCYIGQEVVTRLSTYKKVQKRLMGVALEGDGAFADDAKLLVDQREAGFMTSKANSFRLGRPVALAYVKTAYAKPGARVTVVGPSAAEGEASGALVELPF